MDYKLLILGILSLIVAIWIFPMAPIRMNKGELDHITIKGSILPIILFITGLYFIGKELAIILIKQ